VAFLLTFLGGPLGRWLLMLAVAFGAVMAVKHHWKQQGWDEREAVAIQEAKDRDRAEAAIVGRQVARIAAYSKELDGKLAAANAKVKALEGRLKDLYDTLKGQVPDYVTPQADQRIAACGGIPMGFVLLHDAAARGDTSTGPLPAPPGGGVVNADSGVALSQVESAVVDNYERFHRCLTALKGWEEWYPAVRETYERNLK
jgi:hypothetical protein